MRNSRTKDTRAGIAQAVIFAAKSTEDRRGSIDTQLADCQAMCEREGWAVIDAGADEDKSAYHGERGPELKRLKSVAVEAAKASGAPVAFVVQHSDRISRAAGDEPGAPKALVEIWHELRRQRVWLKSCEDDDDLRDSASVASIGARNYADSKRKGEATKAGHLREVERGRWRGGTLTEGYEVRYEVDSKGRPVYEDGPGGKPVPIVRVEKDEATREIFELIWKLAEEGRSPQAISLELDRRGCRTAPNRRDRKPKPFTVASVRRVLDNVTYAGLQRHGGKVYQGEWEPYVEPGAFWRLKSQREERNAGQRRNAGGRPSAYLLSGLARCANCTGTVRGVSACRPRKDGTRGRWYVCSNHIEHHRDSDEWCWEERWDAATVDREVLTRLDEVLGDSEELRRGLLAGQVARRDRLQRAAEEATEEAAAAERAADRATEEFADAEDDEERLLLKDAAKRKRAEATRARERADAALDALALEPAANPREAVQRLWVALGAKVAEAGDDARAINVALREGLQVVWLSIDGVVAVPMSDEAFIDVDGDSTPGKLHLRPFTLG